MIHGKIDCPCGCGLSLTPRAFKALKYIAGVVWDRLKEPLTVTSGARCEKYNASRGFSKNSAHTLGEAFDISTPHSRIRFLVVLAALEYGLKRAGYAGDKKVQPNSKFIHADCCTEKDRLPDGSGFYPVYVLFDY